MQKFQRNSNLKRILAIFFSFLVLFSMINFKDMIVSDNIINNGPEYSLESASSSDIDKNWIGYGNNRTVHTYLTNDSSLFGQTDKFNITTDTSPSEIYSGDFNFTFSSQIITNYTFEGDSPLYYTEKNQSSRQNIYWNTGETTKTDGYTINKGTKIPGSDSFYLMADGVTSTYFPIISEVSGSENVVNFTYTANFTTVPDFDKTRVIGLRTILNVQVPTRPVTLNVFAYNYITNNWDLMNNNITWDSTSQFSVTYTFPNTKSHYFNVNNQANITFVLNATSGSFTWNLYEIKVEAVYAMEMDITNTNWVAMEFDLKGNATVYGFFAWIRTLDTGTPNSNLTISLYRANQTAVRELGEGVLSSGRNPVMRPKDLIYTRNITNYDWDNYTYIPFKTDFSGIQDLNISNYFVVIYSNLSTVKYSITLLPYGKGLNDAFEKVDPDSRIDHLFLYNDNSGADNNWRKKFLVPYSYQADAAPFAINLSRAIIPTEDLTIDIDSKAIASTIIKTGIYENTSGFKWGLGRWNNIFSNNSRDILKNITIELNWSKDIISSLTFDVNFSSIVYSIENATALYNSTWNQDTIWELNYTFDVNKYNNWKFVYFSYLVPQNWYDVRIYNPNRSDATINITGPVSKEDFNVFSLSNGSVFYSGNGNYTLKMNSTNYIRSVNSYLKFKDYQWISSGIMPGDNASVVMKVINQTKSYTRSENGTAVCELYGVDGNIIGANTLTDTFYSQKEIYPENLKVFDFNKQNILSSNYNTQKGTYYIGFKWTDGDQIGCSKIPLYVSDYEYNILSIDVDKENKNNIIISEIERDAPAPSYNYGWFSINQTSADYRSESPYLNKTLNMQVSAFMINITSVFVNETLLNPGEFIEVNISVHNDHPLVGCNVKFEVRFVQFCNDSWIAFQDNSTEYYVDKDGTVNDNHVFNMILQVPNDYQGYNAPIRLNPLLLQITPVFQGIKDTAFYVDYVFPLINSTEDQFEGKLLGYQIGMTGTGPTIISNPPRGESVLPGITNYFYYIYDTNYISTNYTQIKSFESNLLVDFANVSVEDQLVWNKNFTLQGEVIDELNNPLSGKNILIQYWSGTDWVNYNKVGQSDNILTTNTEGKFSGLFNSSIFSKGSNINLRLLWNGDTDYYENNMTITFTPIIYNNSLSITLINSTIPASVRKGELNKLTFLIENKGNSTIYDIQYNIIIPLIVIESNINNILYEQLAPGESFTVEYQFSLPISYSSPDDYLAFIFTVTGKSLESKEVVQVQGNYSVFTISYTLFRHFGQVLITFFIIGTILFWLYAVKYMKKTQEKLQMIPGTKEKGSERRGRYVTALEAQEIKKKEEKVSETSSESKEEKADVKKTSDLDDLLKEEGLDK